MKSYWHLTFDFQQGKEAISLELTGDDGAIRNGLDLAALAMGDKLKDLGKTGEGNPALMADGLRLYAIKEGGAINPYSGEYLKIERVKNAPGLVVKALVTWCD
jgi:hypothetical protein